MKSTKEHASKTINSLIEELSLDAVMFECASKKDLAHVLARLDEIRKKATKTKQSAVANLLDALMAYLQNDRFSLDQYNEIIARGISFLQQILETEDEQIVKDMDAYIASLTDSDSANENISIIANEEELPEFISGTLSLLEELEHLILNIEKDMQNKDLFDALFRTFHTIKGESSLLAIGNVNKLAHEVESLLEKVRDNEFSLDDAIIALMLNVSDVIKGIVGTLKIDVTQALAVDVEAKIQEIGRILTQKKTEREVIADVARQTDDEIDFEPQIPEIDLAEKGEILAEFLAEGDEHLEGAENSLLELENQPGNCEAVNNIFRKFHTIKGVAGFLDLKDIGALTHDTETLIDFVRKGHSQMTHSIVEAVFQAIDCSRKLFELLKEQISNNGSLKSDYFDITPTILCIRSEIAIIHNNKDKALKPDSSNRIGEILQKKGVVQEDVVRDALEQQRQGDERKIGEILVEQGEINQEELKSGLAEQKKLNLDESIKVKMEKLDNLIEMVGELVIVETQVVQSNVIQNADDGKLFKDIGQLKRIVHNVQNIAMSMRLVPIKPLFQKMFRLIRDLSKKQNKDIEIITVGEETEIDKNIVEQIADPLMHMVRNSVDHGIEPADKRAAKGKANRGKVILKAFHKSGNVVIQIEDDGGGLDKEKILKKAVEKKLIQEDEQLADSRIYNLIFEPGFSTAEKITDVSGRGVGMDVVKKNIEQLRGKIDIASEVGKGSVFSIKLPLTLAIIEGIVFKVSGDNYILPISSVVEFITTKEDAITNVYGKGEMIKIRDNLFQLVRLDNYLWGKVSNQNIEESIICLVDSEHGKVAIVVDELLGDQEVVIKSLGDRFKDVKGVAGGTILGNGRVGLILDANGIVEAVRH